jgi:hypothetical protein
MSPYFFILHLLWVSVYHTPNYMTVLPCHNCYFKNLLYIHVCTSLTPMANHFSLPNSWTVSFIFFSFSLTVNSLSIFLLFSFLSCCSVNFHTYYRSVSNFYLINILFTLA